MNLKQTILTFTALVLFCLGGCDWVPIVKQRRIKAENDKRWEIAVVALAKKHSAVSDWEAKLHERGDNSQLFSIEVSQALIQSNGQPVLLMMRLSDVVEKGGSYSAVFSKEDFEKLSLNVYVELKCSQEQAEQLLHAYNREKIQMYAVVARLESVSHPKSFTLASKGDPENAEVAFEFDPSSDIFFAKGACIEVLQKDETESGK